MAYHCICTGRVELWNDSAYGAFAGTCFDEDMFWQTIYKATNDASGPDKFPKVAMDGLTHMLNGIYRKGSAMVSVK